MTRATRPCICPRAYIRLPLCAAVAIAAHELGHAKQDAEGYFPMRLRTFLVPAVNIGSNLGWVLIMIGLFLRITELAWLGVFVFSAGAVFALATLPVEFNASARAKELLFTTGIIQTEEEQARCQPGIECCRPDLRGRSGHGRPAAAVLYDPGRGRPAQELIFKGSLNCRFNNEPAIFLTFII